MSPRRCPVAGTDWCLFAGCLAVPGPIGRNNVVQPQLLAVEERLVAFEGDLTGRVLWLRRRTLVRDAPGLARYPGSTLRGHARPEVRTPRPVRDAALCPFRSLY